MEHKNRMGRWLQVRKIDRDRLFSTLFSRLVTVYISIIVVTLIILFVTFTNAFQSYFVEYTQNIMIKQAENIAEEYYKIGLYSTSREDVIEKILYRIQIMDSHFEATTWLIDHSNGVVVVSEGVNVPQTERIILNSESVKEVFNGNTVRIENGFKEYFSTPVLTIGYPIKVMNEVQYALFIHTPMPLILQTINEVRNIILKVVGITGTLAFIWIYIISKQMSKPLKAMNTVAKQIASGQFNKRIEVSGNDEISELALSFNNMADELSNIEEKRRKFLANVSHDLRSPLTSIQGFVTAMLDGTIPTDNQEKYLKIVLSESKRMIKMTNTILELSRMEEGAWPLKKVPFHIEPMIKAALASFESRITERNIHIVTHFAEDDFHVIGDIDMISRVVQNLLDNAFKFVEDYGIIKVSTIFKQGKLWVAISNNGPPISEADQRDIWDRFYKADTSRGEDKKGLGLGLVIVKEIMKQHNEIIGVRSKEGEFVTFYFSLTTQKKDEYIKKLNINS